MDIFCSLVCGLPGLSWVGLLASLTFAVSYLEAALGRLGLCPSVPLPEVQGFSSPHGLCRWDPQQGNQTSYVEAQVSPKCKGGSCQAFLRLMSEPGQYQSASLYRLTGSSPGQVQGHGNKGQCQWDNDK